MTFDFETSASINIVDFEFLPQVISEKLKITPTKVWVKGELIHPKAILKHASNGWQFKSDLDSKLSINAHIKMLLAMFDEKEQVFKELSNICHLELSCCIYYKQQQPELNFAPDLLLSIARKKLFLDIDLIQTE